MATPIIINPTKPSEVVVNGTQKSGTPITINTDLDYTRVQSMIDESLGDIDFSALAKEETLADGIASIESKFDNISVDLTPVAKESTLLSESQVIQEAIENIDLSSVESKVEEVGNKIDNIKLPEIDTTEFAKQGENQEATNSKIYEELMKLNGSYADQIKDIVGE